MKWKYDYSGGIEPVIKFKNSGIPWYIFFIYSFKMDRCYKRKYRQKIWSLKEVTIKGQIVTLYPVTSTRTLR